MTLRMLAASLVTLLLGHTAFGDPMADELVLKKAGVGVDGPELLKFLKGSVPTSGGGEEIAPLVKSMASEDFFEREEALKKVIALGSRAAPFLRQALKESDKELVRRAEECLKIIEGGPGADVHGATLRMISTKKPESAAAAVLEYLPFAPTERLGEEAAATLADVALEGGKVAPALTEALDDKFPARRAAAAEALAKAAYIDHKEVLTKLLADSEQQVRLRVGMALALKEEKAAVSVLIDLLEKLPPSPSNRVERLLQKLADSKGPAGPHGSTKAMRDAWAKWWTANEATVDLAKLTAVPKLLGRTLLVHANTGKVEEISDDGKQLWQAEGFQFPVAAQLMGDDKLIVLESRLRRVSIRNLKGAIVKTVSAPLASDLQVLPDGFLVTTRTAIIQFSKEGVQTNRIAMTGNPMVSARKLPAGGFAVLTSTGQVMLLNAMGKETSRFPVGAGVINSGFDATPEGTVLVTDGATGRVLELDTTGKLRHEWKVPGASNAVRLPNGHTLVACSGSEKVVELDERGNVVWEHRTTGSPVIRANKR